jgi:hypothetical protein
MELRINGTPIPLIRKTHRGSRQRRADRLRRLIKEEPCCQRSDEVTVTERQWNQTQKILQTKLTPRQEHKCPTCTFKSFDIVVITKHITECGLRQMDKKYLCDKVEWSFTTNKLGKVNRHRKIHLDLEQQQVTKSSSLSKASPSKKGNEMRPTELALSSVLEK